jgi:hypothetical protein
MLRIDAAPARVCDRISRRELLRIGGLGAAGLSLSDLLRTTAVAKSPTPVAPKARSCIVLFLMGGCF